MVGRVARESDVTRGAHNGFISFALIYRSSSIPPAYHAIMGSGGREREREAESAPAFLPDSWIDSIGLLLLGAHLFLSLLL
jgi:hypothetical protein